MKIDLLVMTIHPDDAELGCAGTILKHVALGKKVGIVDLTRGELGTRGTAESRVEEAQHSSGILGVAFRENVGLRDGFFQNAEYEQREIIKIIRKYQPEIIIGNALYDRHPDHGRAGDLIHDACFLAGLVKVETEIEGLRQEAFRPRLLLQLIQDYYIKPDILVDISPYWEKKLESIRAFKSQFFHEEYASNEPQTYISNPAFLQAVEARAREFGKYIGATYAEGFTSKKLLGVDNLFQLK